MAQALELAEQLGMPVSSSGTCAFPPCLLPTKARARWGHQLAVPHKTFDWDRVRQSDATAAGDHGNVFVPSCADCAARESCPGIQRTYVERHGGSEFVPIADAGFLRQERTQ